MPRTSPALVLEFSRRSGEGDFSQNSEVDKYSNLTEFNRFRVDESGFSSGDSSSTDSDIDLESDTSTEDEATEQAKKRKLANQGAMAFQKRLLDVVSDNDSSEDDDFLPTNIRKKILHSTKDENNIESIMSGMLFERMVNVYVTIVEASAKANNWILIDRIGNDYSPTSELLLEYALTRTQASPVIIVIDSMSRFRSAPRGPGGEILNKAAAALIRLLFQGGRED